jgi:uncharacterized phage-associated protein
MATVHDVAHYILRKQGRMSTWKLQKLVYYSQAWALAWDDEPIFRARIEAWANGPVVPELYSRHKGRFSVDSWPGDTRRIGDDHRDTIDLVLAQYGGLSGRQLSHLTHSEDPWREARKGLASTVASKREITQDAMKAYYEALDADEEMASVEDIDWSMLEAS